MTKEKQNVQSFNNSMGANYTNYAQVTIHSLRGQNT